MHNRSDMPDHMPSLVELEVYRSIKRSDDARDHATLQEIGDDVGVGNIGKIAYRVEKLVRSGLIFKRQGTPHRGIRVNRDEDAHIMVVNDGDMDFEVSERLVVLLRERSGMLIFVSDECLEEARKS